MNKYLLNRVRIIGLLVLLMSTRLSADLLMTHADVDVGVPGVWTYTLFNDEIVGSPNYIDSFSLLIDAPVTVTGTPGGWSVDTDGATFVFWFNTDAVLPYPNDIAPGSSLTGFSLSSPSAFSVLDTLSVASWDHTQDVPGPLSNPLLIDSPSSTSAVPEPSYVFLSPVIILFFCAMKVRHRFQRADHTDHLCASDYHRPCGQPPGCTPKVGECPMSRGRNRINRGSYEC